MADEIKRTVATANIMSTTTSAIAAAIWKKTL